MSSQEYEILDAKLDAIYEMLRAMMAQGHVASGTVGALYVAKLFGCSVRSVRLGKCGTSEVRWTRRQPSMQCTVAEAHAALKRYQDRKPAHRQGLIRR